MIRVSGRDSNHRAERPAEVRSRAAASSQGQMRSRGDKPGGTGSPGERLDIQGQVMLMNAARGPVRHWELCKLYTTFVKDLADSLERPTNTAGLLPALQTHYHLSWPDGPVSTGGIAECVSLSL
ncbi:unnamed protein product [Pleuronectes platessa]|uniref:Uncharacterized protein n=1 Tax=Pleuronectes platessa TaxID=8262 RepID=A0A9N7YDM3_PLEPL|nr:unnamed protein product [Pleuronectes platessa]